MDNGTVAEISVSEAQNHGTGTVAGIIIGCVALLAVISVVSACCYWWKSAGGNALVTLPSKCYTISTGRHTPTTCVPGQNGMERRTTEDTTFMLNYMTHNYIDPVQDNFDLDMDNDYFLHSLESSIHFSQPSSGGCLPNSVDALKMNKDTYYKPRSSTTCGYIKELDDIDDIRYVKSPVGRFHSFNTPKPPSTPVILQPLANDVGASVDGIRSSSFSNSGTAAASGVASASTDYSTIEGRPGSKSLRDGITVLPQHLDSYSSRRESTTQQRQPQQHHHAPNHYPSIYGRIASAATRFSSSSSSTSSSKQRALLTQHRRDKKPQPRQHQLQRQRSHPQPNPESPSAYQLDRGQSLITTFQTKRGKTETLATNANNVLQYPPPMAPISLLLRK